ncbi:hypothetical protein ACFLQK_01200 [bacterium]
MGKKKETGRFVPATVLIVVALVIFGSPILFLKPHAKTPFDREPIYKLRERRPEYVFLGNSMLRTRINPGHMSKLLGGPRVYLFDSNDKYSAHWYLQLKNHLVRSRVKPRAVFILFRDNILTNPEKYTHGKWLLDIERLSLKDEPAVREIIYDNRSTKEKMAAEVNNIYDSLAYRENFENIITGITFLHISPDLLIFNIGETFAVFSDWEFTWKKIAESSDFRKDVNVLFDYKNLRHEKSVREALFLNIEPISVAFNFNERNKESFLPHIIELGKEHDLNLVFIRVQKRPDPTRRNSCVKRQYVRSLRSYIEDNGFVYYDFNGDKKLPYKVYRDGIGHIAPRYKKYYTELFIQRLSFVFDEDAAPDDDK